MGVCLFNSVNLFNSADIALPLSCPPPVSMRSCRATRSTAPLAPLPPSRVAAVQPCGRHTSRNLLIQLWSWSDVSTIVRSLVVAAVPPGFLTYVATAVVGTVLLIWVTPPELGTTNIFVYVGICSIVGSLSVVSCKVNRCQVCQVCKGCQGTFYLTLYSETTSTSPLLGATVQSPNCAVTMSLRLRRAQALGIGLKLTFMGNNQLLQWETGYCAVVRHLLVI